MIRSTLFIVQVLCESRGGRPGLSVLTSLLVSVDVKIYWTMLWHWSQLVPNMSTDKETKMAHGVVWCDVVLLHVCCVCIHTCVHNVCVCMCVCVHVCALHIKRCKLGQCQCDCQEHLTHQNILSATIPSKNTRARKLWNKTKQLIFTAPVEWRRSWRWTCSADVTCRWCSQAPAPEHWWWVRSDSARPACDSLVVPGRSFCLRIYSTPEPDRDVFTTFQAALSPIMGGCHNCLKLKNMYVARSLILSAYLLHTGTR